VGKNKRVKIVEVKVESLLTVEDVAAYLKLEASTIRVMARRGEIPAFKAGRRAWRFQMKAIQEWLQSKQDSTK